MDRTAPKREERDALRALHEAATSEPWLQPLEDERRAIVAAADPSVSLLALDRDRMAIFASEEDATIAVQARNMLPRLLDALDVLEARDAEIARLTAERDTARGEAQATRGWWSQMAPEPLGPKARSEQTRPPPTRERLVLTDAKLRRLEEACKLALELLDAALDEDFDDDEKIRAMSRLQTQDARNLLACALGGS